MPHQFKVWDKKKKRMIGQQWMIHDPDGRFEVLIYSGAKDKNGEDIAPTDIVLYNNERHIVLYDSNCLRWIIVNKDQIIQTIDAEMAKNMEVVGNELIENGKGVENGA